MDVVYFFRHSNKLSEFKIQYSLRSVSANFHQVRKVWIFGDRPAFLSADRNLVEHVPWEAISWLKPVNVPVPNFFQQCFRLARYPEVGFEFLLFNENNVLLSPLSEEVAKRDRYLQDMADVRSLETGLWKESLWRTYDWLRRRGYPGYNFEAGTPLFLTKKRVFEAYRDLSEFRRRRSRRGSVGTDRHFESCVQVRAISANAPSTRRSLRRLSAGAGNL